MGPGSNGNAVLRKSNGPIPTMHSALWPDNKGREKEKEMIPFFLLEIYISNIDFFFFYESQYIKEGAVAKKKMARASRIQLINYQFF